VENRLESILVLHSCTYSKLLFNSTGAASNFEFSFIKLPNVSSDISFDKYDVVDLVCPMKQVFKRSLSSSFVNFASHQKLS
jgi:hypothetical protein